MLQFRKEAEKMLKYTHPTNATQRMWNLKTKVIPVITVATGTISKSFRQYLSNRQEKHEINPLNPELNLICYLLALFGAHHFLHVSKIRVKLLTFRLLMSYIYMESPFLMFLDHTQRRSTVGRTPLDE